MNINENGQYNPIFYHDNNSLSHVKQSSPKALETVAGQFEAMFLQMVLRQMRSGADALASEDSPFSSKQQGVFRDFYDGQISIEMSRNQSAGIAEMLIKQLSPSQVEQVVQMAEPANQPTLSKVDATLNQSQDSVASINREVINEQQQQTMTTVAFQQPLIRKMES